MTISAIIRALAIAGFLASCTVARHYPPRAVVPSRGAPRVCMVSVDHPARAFRVDGVLLTDFAVVERARGPAHDPTREEVDDSSEIEPAFAGRDERESATHASFGAFAEKSSRRSRKNRSTTDSRRRSSTTRPIRADLNDNTKNAEPS
jgi:hypothetical protein